MMSRIVLGRVCDYTIEEGWRSQGVQGLAPVPDRVEGEAETAAVHRGSGLSELVAIVDSAAVDVASASSGSAEASLRPLSAALDTIVAAGMQQELDAVGVLHVTRTALVASSWLAESSRASASPRINVEISIADGLSVEECEDVKKELTTVWQALAQQTATPAARRAAKASKSASEASELLCDVNARFAALQASPRPPPPSANRPMQAELPSRLVARLCEAMSSSPTSKLRAPVVSSTTDHPAAKTGFLCKVSKLLELAAWVGLLGGVAVAVSADGLGLARFHIVPESLRPSWQAILFKYAIRLEELCESDNTLDVDNSNSGNYYPLDNSRSPTTTEVPPPLFQGHTER
jgi:hypothetical protein